MAREAVIDTTTGSVKRIGREGFATSDDLLGSESVVTLTDTTDFVPGVLFKHHKVVASVLTEMTSGEKTTVDATFPTILGHRAQFVKEARDPTTADDLDKGFFPGARWLRTDTKRVFWNRTNPPGAAIWDQLGAGSANVIEFISAVKTTAHTIPTSPAPVAFDTIIAQSTSPPFTHDGSGTFTAVRTGLVQIDMEITYERTSGSTTSRLEIQIFFSTGGAYLVLPAETTTQASPSRTRIWSTLVQDGYVNLTTIVSVTSGHTFRGYNVRDGSSTGTTTANMQRIHFRELKAS